VSEIQKEFNPAAKFVQIAVPREEPAILFALDEDGGVWHLQDLVPGLLGFPDTPAGWRPLPSRRIQPPRPMRKEE
jgi:hypothetical protein